MRTVVVVCVIAASAFVGPPAWASFILDQHQENQGYLYQSYNKEGELLYEGWQGFSHGVGGPTMMAQTFTAGLTGTLHHIQIGNTSGASYYDPRPPVVEIRTWQGDQPGSLLGSFEYSSLMPSNGWTESIPGLEEAWTLPTGASSIPVIAGQMYSIVVRANVASGEYGGVSVGAVGTAGDGPSTLEDPEGWLYPDRELPWSYPDGDLWAWNGSTWLLLSSNLFDQPVYDMQFRTYVVPVPLPAGVWLGICAVSVAGWHLKRQRG